MGLDNVASGYLLSCVDVHSDIIDDTGFFYTGHIFSSATGVTVHTNLSSSWYKFHQSFSRNLFK